MLLKLTSIAIENSFHMNTFRFNYFEMLGFADADVV